MKLTEAHVIVNLRALDLSLKVHAFSPELILKGVFLL